MNESFLGPRVIPQRPGISYVDVTDIRINAGRKKAAEKMLKAFKSP